MGRRSVIAFLCGVLVGGFYTWCLMDTRRDIEWALEHLTDDDKDEDGEHPRV